MDSPPDAPVRDVPDLCRPFLGALPVTGATIAVMVASGARVTLCSSDPVAARLDELQFELGEGPQWAAAQSGAIVRITDVASATHDAWPVFGEELSQLDIGAVFCVPIQMGAVTLGVATLYCTSPRELTPDQEVTALAIASAVAAPAAHEALRVATDEGPALESTVAPSLRREVHQATGMILVQLNTSATVAYSRLQAYAFAQGRTVQDVAHDVVAGTLIFDETTP